MIEIIDQETNQKMMAMVLCSICYKDDYYIIYAVQRDKVEANIFVSKLVRNSRGYVMSLSFSEAEKKILESVVQRFINRESKDLLEKDGFILIDDAILDDLHYFDIEKCYVSTVSKTLIKDCMIHYNLVNERLFEQPIVEVIEEKSKFNEGFVSNMALIGLGIFILGFSIFVIFGVLFN